jgi:hypothetical protein
VIEQQSKKEKGKESEEGMEGVRDYAGRGEEKKKRVRRLRHPDS